MNFKVGNNTINVRFRHRRRQNHRINYKFKTPMIETRPDAFGGETICSLRLITGDQELCNAIQFVGHSKCRNNEVFNNRIGNAFSLRRAIRKLAEADILPKEDRMDLFDSLDDYFEIVRHINACSK